MLILINCAHCSTALQLPPNARSILCSVCGSVTHVAPLPPPGPAAGPHSLSHGPAPPSPRRGPPWGLPAPADARKRAVICGVSYKRSRYHLKGSINDAKCMKYFLVNRFDFPEECILMLTGR